MIFVEAFVQAFLLVPDERHGPHPPRVKVRTGPVLGVVSDIGCWIILLNMSLRTVHVRGVLFSLYRVDESIIAMVLHVHHPFSDITEIWQGFPA